MPEGIHLVQSESFPVLKLNLSKQFKTSKKKNHTNNPWVNITCFLLSLRLFLSFYLSIHVKTPLLWEAAVVHVPDTFWKRYDKHFYYNNKQ